MLSVYVLRYGVPVCVCRAVCPCRTVPACSPPTPPLISFSDGAMGDFIYNQEEVNRGMFELGQRDGEGGLTADQQLLQAMTGMEVVDVQVEERKRGAGAGGVSSLLPFPTHSHTCLSHATRAANERSQRARSVRRRRRGGRVTLTGHPD